MNTARNARLFDSSLLVFSFFIRLNNRKNRFANGFTRYAITHPMITVLKNPKKLFTPPHIPVNLESSIYDTTPIQIATAIGNHGASLIFFFSRQCLLILIHSSQTSEYFLNVHTLQTYPAVQPLSVQSD